MSSRNIGTFGVLTFFLTLVSVLLCLPLYAQSEDAYLRAYMVPEGEAVVVDGNVEHIWDSAPCADVAKVDELLIPSQTETNGKFRTLWDESYLYLLIEVDKHGENVVSPCVGEAICETDDSVEVDFSLNGRFDVCPADGSAKYCGTFLSDLDGNTDGSGWLYEHFSDKIECSMKITDSDKYLVEMAIPWIFPSDVEYYGHDGVGVGSRVALEITINVLGESGRYGLVTWASTPPTGWLTTENAGTVELFGVSEEYAAKRDDLYKTGDVWSPDTIDKALNLGIAVGAMAIVAVWMIISRKNRRMR